MRLIEGLGIQISRADSIRLLDDQKAALVIAFDNEAGRKGEHECQQHKDAGYQEILLAFHPVCARRPATITSRKLLRGISGRGSNHDSQHDPEHGRRYSDIAPWP